MELIVRIPLHEPGSHIPLRKEVITFRCNNGVVRVKWLIHCFSLFCICLWCLIESDRRSGKWIDWSDLP